MKQNPYRATAHVGDSGNEEVIPRPVGLLVFAIIEACVTLFAGWKAPIVIGNFESLYKGFGADLPGPTSFLLATRYGWWIFFLIALLMLIWIGIRENQPRSELRRKKLVLTLLAIVFGVTFGFMIYALYLPIFRLGAVV